VDTSQALVDKQAMEMAVRHREEAHQRELLEAVDLVEELQAAALSDSKRNDEGVQQRLSKLKVSTEAAAASREDELANPAAESKAAAAATISPRKSSSEVLDTLSKLATPSDTHAATAAAAVEQPKRSAMLHMLEKLGPIATATTPPERDMKKAPLPPVSRSMSSGMPPPKTSEVLSTLSKLSTPPGSSDHLSSAEDVPPQTPAVEPTRSAMLDMLTKLATPPASEDAAVSESGSSLRSSEPRSSVLDMLTLLATPPDEEAAATSAKSGNTSEVLDTLSKLAAETEEVTKEVRTFIGVSRRFAGVCLSSCGCISRPSGKTLTGLCSICTPSSLQGVYRAGGRPPAAAAPCTD